MGNKATANATELHQFSAKLNQAADACTNLFQHLNAETHRICETWQDDKATKFLQDFDVSKQEIDKISQQMRDFSGYVSRLAQRIDDYMNQR